MAKAYVNRTIQMGGKIRLPGDTVDLNDRDLRELSEAGLVVPFPTEPTSEQLLAAAEKKAKEEAAEKARLEAESKAEEEAKAKAKSEEEAKAAEAAKAKAAK